MNTAEIFDGMNELLSAPERWTHHTLARTEGGDACNPSSQHAFCFCILGALAKVADGDDNYGRARHTMIKLAEEMGFSGPAHFNDDEYTEHYQILEFIDACKQRSQE